MLKWILCLAALFCAAWLFGASQVSIMGAKVKIQGYAYIGPSQAVVVVSSASTAGQCFGLLCGITKAN